MEWLAAAGLNDDAELVSRCAHERADGEERDRVDERLHQRGVEFVARESREDQARALRWGGILIRPRAGDRLVDVGHRDDLAHRMWNRLAEIGIAAALHAAMMFECDGGCERMKTVGLHENLGAER